MSQTVSKGIKMASRSRVGPVIFMIVVLAVLVAIAPMLAKYQRAPAVVMSKLQKMTAPPPKAPSSHKTHSVWVNRRSGLYYCHDSHYFGRLAPGTYMQQERAILKGFRPAEGHACH